MILEDASIGVPDELEGVMSNNFTDLSKETQSERVDSLAFQACHTPPRPLPAHSTPLTSPHPSVVLERSCAAVVIFIPQHKQQETQQHQQQR